MIVIVFGLPGSGKSFFAAKLAEQINAVYLSSDRLRFKMYPVRSYSESEKETVYTEMLNETRKHLLEKRDVVVDATFYRDALRKKFLNALDFSTKVFFIEVIANESIALNRLSKQRPDSEATSTVYHKIRTLWEPLKEEHLVLESTDTNSKDMLDKAIQYLDDKK